MSSVSPTHHSTLEAALTRAGQRPRFLAGVPTVDRSRAGANLAAIQAEVDAPRVPWLARLLRRLGVREQTIPLVTATPGLRRSWLAAVVVALLFAIGAASDSQAEGVERIVVFLTMAPLIPLLGVALAFGRGVDPTHEIVIAAPMDAFRVFLVRAATVLATSTVILLVASAMVPEGGLARIAWLLPAVAATAATMALATRIDPRYAAFAVATAWVTIVVIINQTTDPATTFGPVTQVVCLVIAFAGAIVFHQRRRRLDLLSEDR